jgi:hypothetical protein
MIRALFCGADHGIRLDREGGMRRIERLLSCLARPVAAASLLGLALLVACGGTQLGSGAGSDGGGIKGDGGTFTEPDGAVCVDIDLSSYDRSCTTSSDCIAISAGTLCSTGCLCGGSTINKSGDDRYQATLAQLSSGGPVCDCPFFGQSECHHGSCTLCSGPTANPECSDGGTTVSDGSVGDEVVTADAGRCVEVDLADYDQSCKSPSDCTLIKSGAVCAGSCNCGASPVNISGEAKYEKAVSGITFEDCPCVSPGPLDCIGGKCTVCSGTTHCPDGG